MRDQIYTGVVTLLRAKMVGHKINIKLLLENSQTIPEHTDIVDAIQKELKLMAEYKDALETFEEYFGR